MTLVKAPRGKVPEKIDINTPVICDPNNSNFGHYSALARDIQTNKATTTTKYWFPLGRDPEVPRLILRLLTDGENMRNDINDVGGMIAEISAKRRGAEDGELLIHRQLVSALVDSFDDQHRKPKEAAGYTSFACEPLKKKWAATVVEPQTEMKPRQAQAAPDTIRKGTEAPGSCVFVSPAKLPDIGAHLSSIEFPDHHVHAKSGTELFHNLIAKKLDGATNGCGLRTMEWTGAPFGKKIIAEVDGDYLSDLMKVVFSTVGGSLRSATDKDQYCHDHRVAFMAVAYQFLKKYCFENDQLITDRTSGYIAVSKHEYEDMTFTSKELDQTNLMSHIKDDLDDGIVQEGELSSEDDDEDLNEGDAAPPPAAVVTAYNGGIHIYCILDPEHPCNKGKHDKKKILGFIRKLNWLNQRRRWSKLCKFQRKHGNVIGDDGEMFKERRCTRVFTYGEYFNKLLAIPRSRIERMFGHWFKYKLWQFCNKDIKVGHGAVLIIMLLEHVFGWERVTQKPCPRIEEVLRKIFRWDDEPKKPGGGSIRTNYKSKIRPHPYPQDYKDPRLRTCFDYTPVFTKCDCRFARAEPILPDAFKNVQQKPESKTTKEKDIKVATAEEKRWPICRENAELGWFPPRMSVKTKEFPSEVSRMRSFSGPKIGEYLDYRAKMVAKGEPWATRAEWIPPSPDTYRQPARWVDIDDFIFDAPGECYENREGFLAKQPWDEFDADQVDGNANFPQGLATGDQPGADAGDRDANSREEDTGDWKSVSTEFEHEGSLDSDDDDEDV